MGNKARFAAAEKPRDFMLGDHRGQLSRFHPDDVEKVTNVGQTLTHAKDAVLGAVKKDNAAEASAS